MRYTPEHFDRLVQELARRLGRTKDEILHMPVIEVASEMGRKNVGMGLRVEVSND